MSYTTGSLFNTAESYQKLLAVSGIESVDRHNKQRSVALILSLL